MKFTTAADQLDISTTMVSNHIRGLVHFYRGCQCFSHAWTTFSAIDAQALEQLLYRALTRVHCAALQYAAAGIIVLVQLFPACSAMPAGCCTGMTPSHVAMAYLSTSCYLQTTLSET
ncbi:hypothetical protein [Cupriavidus pauculus]|uniref:Uncharacterized protein n=1 Tax=Cupriavidus pauculus TaxID=82633 RepID=A0A2N5C5J2_9BURK|nr:hypothetical protein [Cupriavidus pauculus]PLP97481.1 hypothetical protein CYJ10_26980 [Cupriavidus pauculus]